mgnify:CR=1 FL=1
MNNKKATIDTVLNYANEKYGTIPEYLWLKTPDSAVLRHQGSKKWYGIIMNIKKKALGIDDDGYIDILNIKCEPLIRECLLSENKAYPAYHMNKKFWISLPLDGSLSLDEVCGAIDESYNLVK